MNPPVFLRRLGPESSCYNTSACPDILELADGDFAVIGTDITAESHGRLPPRVGCGNGERIVRIPRKVMLAALPDMPAS